MVTMTRPEPTPEDLQRLRELLFASGLPVEPGDAEQEAAVTAIRALVDARMAEGE
jgi:hypothetical protein